MVAFQGVDSVSDKSLQGWFYCHYLNISGQVLIPVCAKFKFDDLVERWSADLHDTYAPRAPLSLPRKSASILEKWLDISRTWGQGTPGCSWNLQTFEIANGWSNEICAKVGNASIYAQLLNQDELLIPPWGDYYWCWGCPRWSHEAFAGPMYLEE